MHEAEHAPTKPEIRRFRSIPGSHTVIYMEIKDREEYSLRFYSDVPPPEAEYKGMALLDDQEISLFEVGGGSVDFRREGAVYVRKDLPIEEAYPQGWCISELNEDKVFLDFPSVEQFLDSMDVLASCKPQEKTAGVPGPIQDAFSAMEVYSSNNRLIWKNDPGETRSGMSSMLFKLSEHDPLPLNEHREVLDREHLKKNIVALIGNLKGFEGIKSHQVVEFKQWFEDREEEQIRALYFLMDTGERYFCVKIYEHQGR